MASLRVLRRGWALAGLVLLVLPAAGSAHALLVSSNPRAGARLARPPARVAATFSEPLDRSLSHLSLQTATGVPVPAVPLPVAAAPAGLTLRPLRQLRQGVYRVEWHTVSALDGHTATGVYLFSVAAPLPGAGSHAAPAQATGGWSALLLRSAFDGALILFCGGIFCAVLLSPPGAPAGWLLADLYDRGGAYLWRRTVRLGVGALLLSAAVTLQDAVRATGSLSPQSLHAYLAAAPAGYAQAVVVVALLLSVLMAARGAPVPAGAGAVVALTAVVFAGHARATALPGLAVSADVVHLAAASVWIGGVAQLAAVCVPRLRRGTVVSRNAVIRRVLPRFGRVALPAFALLVVAGAVTAATELPSLSALWSTAYGRVLLVKAGLVMAIASLSYLHVYWLRPRLLTRPAGGPPIARAKLERRHWRLLALEPLLGAGIIVAAAWLVVEGPPAAWTATRSTATANQQLSVAEQAGPYIISAVITHGATGVTVKLQTLDRLERPGRQVVRVAGASSQRGCGVGCTRVTLAHDPSTIGVAISARATAYHASLPVRFDPGSNAPARRLLSEVATATRQLKSVAIRETLGSGTLPPDLTDYRVQAPNRFAYQVTRAGHPVSEVVIVGGREWTRTPGHPGHPGHPGQPGQPGQPGRPGWTAGLYGGGAQFSAASYLEWWSPYTTDPLLLGRSSARAADGQVEIATAGEVPGLGTVWLRFTLDVPRRRILRIGMITVAHFMTQSWSDFDAAPPVTPPVSLGDR